MSLHALWRFRIWFSVAQAALGAALFGLRLYVLARRPPWSWPPAVLLGGSALFLVCAVVAFPWRARERPPAPRAQRP